MSRLDANAKEWRPSAPYMGPLELPTSSAAMEQEATTPPPTKPAYDAEAPEFIPSYVRAAATAMPAAADTMAPTMGTATLGGGVPGGLPSYAALSAGGSSIDWSAEFESVMALTGQLIHTQLFGEPEAAQATPEPEAAAAEEEAAAATTAATTASPPKPSYAAVVSASAKKPTTATTSAAAASSSTRAVADGTASSPATASTSTKKGTAPPSSAALTSANLHPNSSSSVAPSTFGGAASVSEAGRPRHWKKQTKGQQRREMEQKNAFESFANALLHSVSPFMAPLRARCHTSLPHLKLDQRFGKSGQPQTAIAQFVVAPLITNYRPRHFHDVTPGDLMEFHYDLSQVMRVITSSKSLHVGYGPVWKRFAIPYMYLACAQYRKEVLSLCPDETPNSRAEAIYEDDIVKDITEVVLSVDELKPLQTMSMRQAMKLRVNLAPLYDAFEAVFQPLENYMIEITDFDKVPSTFLLKTSKLEVEQKPQPIVLYGDETLWYDLPVVSRVVQLGGGAEPETSTDGPSSLTAATTAATGAPVSATTTTSSAAATASPAAAAAASNTAMATTKPAAAAGGASPAAENGEGVNWLLVAPLALSACAVVTTAALLVLKKSK